MAVHAGRRTRRIKGRRSHGLAVVAVGVGMAAAAGHGVAWADGTGTDHSTDHSASHADAGATRGPAKAGHERRARRDRSSADDAPADSGSTGTSGTASDPGSDLKKPEAGQPDSSAPGAGPRAPRIRRGQSRTSAAATPLNAPSDTSPTQQVPSPKLRDHLVDRPIVRRLAAAAADPAAAAVADAAPAVKMASVTTAVTTPSAESSTPQPPGPLSPSAKLGALPGRIVNAVLQALDLTSAVGGPQSPLNFAPIDEALFAAFRRTEDVLGLEKTPPAQQTPPSETYTGDTTAVTPTVSQFLNAAAAEYVLGGTPGELKPLTVNGQQLTSTNVLSGESAKAWVTSQGQVIIAYQGTTGGTNLLFHPLIAISQVVTDAQIIFTDTTPQAFTDSLAFEQQVQAAAAEQGYDQDDIFVTGHSLGGWEAEYVAQQTGLGGIGFESPGINTVVDNATVGRNGIDSGFVNVETYGDTAAYLSTDLPGLQPFMPAYVPAGGSKPHYGSIIMIGDPEATNPLVNASSLWGTGLVGDAIFAVDILGNFFEHHLPGMQAYNLDVTPDPGVVTWLGATTGPVEDGWGDLTIPQLEQAASDAHTLFQP